MRHEVHAPWRHWSEESQSLHEFLRVCPRLLIKEASPQGRRCQQLSELHKGGGEQNAATGQHISGIVAITHNSGVAKETTNHNHTHILCVSHNMLTQGHPATLRSPGRSHPVTHPVTGHLPGPPSHHPPAPATHHPVAPSPGRLVTLRMNSTTPDFFDSRSGARSLLLTFRSASLPLDQQTSQRTHLAQTPTRVDDRRVLYQQYSGVYLRQDCWVARQVQHCSEHVKSAH